MTMKITPQKIARALMFAGFLVFFGTLVTHYLIMDSPEWIGRHPGWSDVFIPVGLAMFGLGAVACVLTRKPSVDPPPAPRSSIVEWIIVLIIIGILAAVIFPTVC